jgi:hypothetical protein
MRWLLLLLAAVGCAEPGAPVVEALRYDGQAPDSTLVLLFSIDFSDDEGDLGEGKLETFINQRVAGNGIQSLRPLFLQAGERLDATSGTVPFVIELNFAGAPERGAGFSVGVRLTDEGEQTSTTKETSLRIE